MSGKDIKAFLLVSLFIYLLWHCVPRQDTFGGRSVKILQMCQRDWSCKVLRTCCHWRGVSPLQMLSRSLRSRLSPTCLLQQRGCSQLARGMRTQTKINTGCNLRFALAATGFSVSPSLLVALISSASLEIYPLLDIVSLPAAFPPQCPACPSGDAWTINRALAEASREWMQSVVPHSPFPRMC